MKDYCAICKQEIPALIGPDYDNAPDADVEFDTLENGDTVHWTCKTRNRPPHSVATSRKMARALAIDAALAAVPQCACGLRHTTCDLPAVLERIRRGRNGGLHGL